MWQKSKDTLVETQSLGLGRFLPHEYLAFSFALQSTQAWTTVAQTAPWLRQAGRGAQGRPNPGPWGAWQGRHQSYLATHADLQQSQDLPHPAPGTQRPCQALLAAAPLAEKGGSKCSVRVQSRGSAV